MKNKVRKLSEFKEIYSVFDRLKSAFYSFDGDISEFSDKIYKNGICLSYFDESEIPAGVIAFYANNQSTKTAFLTSLLVDEKYRGQGIATALLLAMENYCIKNGFIKIRLEVKESNLSAIGLYEKMKYQKRELLGTSLYMEKDLGKNEN